MVKQAALRAVDLEPIDRLEEKITLLVAMVNRLRAEQAKADDDNARLTQSDGVTNELSTLRDERELIRTRVTDMLEQLEHLNL